jgi:hypothetical protein
VLSLSLALLALAAGVRYIRGPSGVRLLIAVVAMVAVQTLGTGVAGVFTRVVNRITGIG